MTPDTLGMDAWRRLYQAALAFRDLKPWKWMSDDQLFGVRSPATGETLYCAVLGAAGEMFSLSVYPGPQGLAAYLSLVEGNTPTRDFRAMMRCLMADFENRAALDFPDREQIKSLGLSIRGSKAWPMFRSHSPWKFPWFLDPEEVPPLTVALEQAVDVCTRARSNPKLLPSDSEMILIRSQSLSDGPWGDLVERLPVEDEVDAEIPPPDPNLVAALKSGPMKRRGEWDLDFGCAPQPLQEVPGTRPVIPLVLMITDRKTGAILSLEVARGGEGEAALRDHLIKFANEHRHLPKRWHVCKSSVYGALELVSHELGVDLELESQLNTIDEAYESLAESLEGDAERLDLLSQ
jgi:hypothetical protein